MIAGHMLDHNSAPIHEPRATPPIEIDAFRNPNFAVVQSYVEDEIHKLFLDGDWNEGFDHTVTRKVLRAMYSHADYQRIVERIRMEMGR